MSEMRTVADVDAAVEKIRAMAGDAEVAPGCDDCERIQADGRTAGDGTHAT